MQHHICNFRNKDRPGSALFATTPLCLKLWPLTSKCDQIPAHLNCTNHSDRYVKSILKSTSRSVDQVTIQPDGKWELNIRKENNSRNSGVASASDDDDDLVEITKSGDSVKMGTPRAYGTPFGSGSNGSAPPSGPPKTTSSSSSTKRSHAVIDLTSSGDEDDEPLARQPKRQQTNGHTPMPPVYRPPTNGY